MTSLCDRALLGEGEPTKGQLCQIFSASGLTLAAIGAGIGGATAGITSLAHGVYPWEDPLEFLKREAIGAGTGSVGSLLGNAIGVALGPSLGMPGSSAGSAGSEAGAGSSAGGAAAGDTAAAGLGIGTNTGTVAAESGAMVPQNLSGMISRPASDILSGAGTRSTESVIARALENFGQQGTFTDALKNAVGGLPRNVLTSSISGAANNPRDPLRGALTGAAGAVASTGIGALGQATFRGQEAGFFSPGPSKGVEFARTGYQPSGYSLLSDSPSPSTASSGFGLRPEMSGPGLGDRFARVGVSAASRLGGGAASRAVGSALTPSPRVAPPNPYESYGYTPYWMRR